MTVYMDCYYFLLALVVVFVQFNQKGRGGVNCEHEITMAGRTRTQSHFLNAVK